MLKKDPKKPQGVWKSRDDTDPKREPEMGHEEERPEIGPDLQIVEIDDTTSDEDEERERIGNLINDLDIDEFVDEQSEETPGWGPNRGEG